MWPVSQAFIDQISAASSKLVVRADVLSNNTVVATGLNVVSGSVEIDTTATARRRMSCRIVDPTGAMIPNDATDLLSPYGREIRLWRGFRFDNGTEELAPLGTFRLSSASTNDSGSPTVTLTGMDRARSVSRAKFEQPYSIAAGTNVITAVQTLLQSRLPRIQFSSTTTPQTTGAVSLFDQASDPWAAATTLVNSIGCEVFFDPLGICVIRTQPNPVSTPVTYTYTDGVNATVMEIENQLTDEPGYNGVVVDGEPPQGIPVHSVVYDTAPNSPANANGDYGKVPFFMKSQLIYSQAQADEAAAATLRREKGGTEQVSVTALPNPAHEGDDLVHVTRDEIGIDTDYLLQAISIPLGIESMKLTMQKRRTA